MTEVLRIPLTGGGYLYAELPELEPGVHRAGRLNDMVDAAAESLDEVLGTLSRASTAILDSLRRARPQEIEVEFSVRFNAQVGAVIAQTGTEGHLQVRLLWKNEVTDG